MNFLKNIFKSKNTPIQSYKEFWAWFCANEQSFYKVIKGKGDPEKDFFNKLSPKLNELRDGFWYSAGMYDDNTAELIISAEGVIKNIVFTEALINAAPKVDRWKFTALKPALNIEDVNIEMAGHNFTGKNLHFCVNENAGYPDEIDITVIHDDYSEEDKSAITTGVYIFLDHYLGELDFALNIDNLKVAGRKEADKELIAIGKLKDYLNWRQKEFVEKYERQTYNTENDQYSLLEANHENGDPLIAVINTTLLNWDRKASHPWILIVTIPYKENIGKGMPDKNTNSMLEEIETEIVDELKHAASYLNIGRQTGRNLREIYFACTTFRKPSLSLYKIQKSRERQFDVSYNIYKDKYWQSFNRYSQSRL
ncbi:MAG: DUF695 domain-containing protein [Taibaiella sp.]|nr:DUF695 domain-containing protein [Taibaiella sp.]